MANVQVRFKAGAPSMVVLDRVPVAGDYITSGPQLFRVLSAVFTPNGGNIDAVVFVAKDADGKPDELGAMPS